MLSQHSNVLVSWYTSAWRSGEHSTHAVLLQVCDREDSETYAKRTITEIETCLGFTFHGAAEEEAPETITNAELEVCMVIAAWQQQGWRQPKQQQQYTPDSYVLQAAANHAGSSQQ